MSFLVDTHVFLWFEARSPRLSVAVRDLIARTEQPIHVSAASFWEIALKRRAGKLTFTGSPREAAGASGFIELPIDAADAELAGGLDWDHRDPFDRALVAQAINRGLTLMTADATLLALSNIALLRAL